MKNRELVFFILTVVNRSLDAPMDRLIDSGEDGTI